MDNMNTSCFPIALAALKGAKSANERIDNLPLPMVFKGSLGTGGTISTLPTASSENEGFVYIVITDGTYAGQSAKAGDTFISDGSSWVLVPSADEPSPIDDSVTSTALTWSSSKIASECKLKSFEYVGQGNNPHTITFPDTPKIILAIQAENIGGTTWQMLGTPIIWGFTRMTSFTYAIYTLGQSLPFTNVTCEFSGNDLILTGTSESSSFDNMGKTYTVCYI